MQQLRRCKQSVSAIYVHLVFVVKYRRKVFHDEHLKRLQQIFQDVGQSMGFRVLEMNGEADHVHLLVEHPPKYSVSTLVNHLKGVSSRLLRKEYKLTPHSEHLWSPSYFAASCGGAPIEVIRQYIEQQGTKPP
jgi:putative transposase